MPYSIPRLLSFGKFAILPLVVFSTTIPSQAQNLRDNPVIAQANPTLPQPSDLNGENADPDDLRPLNQSESLLSLAGGQRLMNEASEAINAERYDLAIDKLQQARKIFNQLSNFHLQLANSFSGIDP